MERQHGDSTLVAPCVQWSSLISGPATHFCNVCEGQDLQNVKYHHFLILNLLGIDYRTGFEPSSPR